MSTPPRRRRPDSRSSKSEGGGGWLPTIAMCLGVVVAGLGIGALVAVLMQRSTGKLAPASEPVAVATSVVAPGQPQPRPPTAIATIMRPPTPHSFLSPSAAPEPSPSDSYSPSAASSPDHTASPSATPRPTPVQSAAPRPSPSRLVAAVPVPLVTAAKPAAVEVPLHTEPRPTREPSAAPTAAPSVEPIAAPPTAVVRATATAEPSATNEAVSAYDEHASAVVRRYVDALVRGDEKTALSVLGGSGGTLSEQAFIDSSARIVSLKVTRIDASNASVGCEIASAKGRYYATYHVTAASSGPYISEHDYIKV